MRVEPSEVEAYLHLWRFIGVWLGIADEVNPCTIMDSFNAIMVDFGRNYSIHPEYIQVTADVLVRNTIYAFSEQLGHGGLMTSAATTLPTILKPFVNPKWINPGRKRR